MSKRNYPRPILLHHITCPECGVPMVQRERKSSPEIDLNTPVRAFYGCSRFPLCVGTRPIEMNGLDSYTRLLRDAYTKAAVFLSSPKFFGVPMGAYWLLGRALNVDPEGLIEKDWIDVLSLRNEEVEQAVDDACAYVAAQGVDHDFILAAHEARMAQIRPKLRFDTSIRTMRNMLEPVIMRRYDTGLMLQMEANVASTWEANGKACPKCNQWAPATGENMVHCTTCGDFVACQYGKKKESGFNVEDNR